MLLSELKLSKKRREVANILNLNTVEEVLYYLPIRYDSFLLKDISDWQIKEKIIMDVTIATRCVTIQYQRSKYMSKFDVIYKDELVHVVAFNQYWLSKQIIVGEKMVIIGIYQGDNKIVMTGHNTKNIEDQLGIIPVYPLKDGVSAANVISLVAFVLKVEANNLLEDIPSYYLEKYQLIGKKESLINVHQPNSDNDLHQALRYLKYSELLKFNLAILLSREKLSDKLLKDPKKINMKPVEKLIANLDFKLTKDQLITIENIYKDLVSDKIMYRLIQGDVGSGKTIVAIIAMYMVAISDYQAVILAPTQILARQHYEEIKKLISDFSISLVVGGMKNKEKSLILDDIKSGKSKLIIGTHALFSDDIEFNNLGLIVIDEQQRFGVKQRKSLKEKSEKADFLVMSATPIPRTLAASIYADMDVSTIYTKPLGRQEVITELVEKNSIIPIYDQLTSELDLGHQVYIVCPAIEENENFRVRNVTSIYENLTKEFRGKYKLALLHGQLKQEDKDKVMSSFINHQVDILVTTTVIEVGVSVKNATMMIIYDADRFGLSQIHQLRGRVQRGNKQGYCYLLTNSKQDETLQRLRVLVDESDGFEISKEDLKLRGPGDLLGERQSGGYKMYFANLIDDLKILQISKDDAINIINNQTDSENGHLLEIVEKDNQENLDYID